MRINKATEYYIRNLINEKAQTKYRQLNKDIDEIETQYEKVVEQFRKQIRSVFAEANRKANELADKSKSTVKYTGWERNRRFDYCPDLGGWDAVWSAEHEKMKESFKKKRDELMQKVSAKCDEVIARLTLGGTAKDLDEMLACIEF